MEMVNLLMLTMMFTKENSKTITKMIKIVQYNLNLELVIMEALLMVNIMVMEDQFRAMVTIMMDNFWKERKMGKENLKEEILFTMESSKMI